MVSMVDDVTVANEESSEAKPEGADFFVALPDGHKVWFREFKFGQRLMIFRAYDLTKVARQKIIEASGTAAEKLEKLAELSLRSDKRLWDAIDSIIIDPEDIDRVMDSMIIGAIDEKWAWKVMAGGKEPPEADDAEDVQVKKPSRRANAKRTQIR